MLNFKVIAENKKANPRVDLVQCGGFAILCSFSVSFLHIKTTACDLI